MTILGRMVAGLALAWPLHAAAQETTAAPVEAASGLAEPKVGALEPIPPTIATSAFASQNQLQGAKLSPDGSRIGFEAKIGGVPHIVFLDAGTRKAIGKVPAASDTEIEWFRWAGNDKVVLSLSTQGRFFGDDARFTRLSLIHLTEGWAEPLGSKSNALIGDDVIFIADDGSHLLVSTQRTAYEYPSVYRYELERDGDTRQVQSHRDGVWSWYADNDGVVRAGSGWYRNRLRIYYRSGPDRDLKLVGKLKEDDLEDKFWDVAQIVSGSDQGYVLQEGEDGRVGLYLFNYATREIIEPVYVNPDWDVESVIIRKGKPIGVFYTDDRERVVWLDEEYEKQYAALGKALQEDVVWVTSRAEDKSRMLVWAGGPSDPGALYVFSPEEKRLDQLAEMRPNVDFRVLSAPKPISYEARDGTTIQGYLTLPRGREAKGLPLILMPHGGPYGIRDTLSYNDEVQLLANRGYAVLQPNYRGSGGYGDAFFELGEGQIGRGMQDDLDDAMDWAVNEGIADKSRVCVVGGSYGGYAALWSVIRNPERYRCAASWAGVTDWELMLKYDRRFLSGKANKKWQARVQGDGKFDLDSVSPYRLGETLSRPVLLAHGTDDSRVPFAQFKKFRKAAANASVQPVELVIEDEGHSFSKPENEQAWYDALVAFLGEHNPAD